MNLDEMAKELHEVAVLHGWWDKPVKLMTSLALIHSEWSEALEEYRHAMPVCYCNDSVTCEDESFCAGKAIQVNSEAEQHRVCAEICGFRSASSKPEGAWVELIDGIIRILDLFGQNEYRIPYRYHYGDLRAMLDNPRLMKCDKDMDFPELIFKLHSLTTLAVTDFEKLVDAIILACRWIDSRGGDAEELIRLKSAYNERREYRHGNKVC